MTSFAPFALALLRIVAGALLLEHGLIKLIGFPEGAAPGKIAFDIVTQWQHPPQLWIGAIIETVTGVMLILGLFTRFAAFFASGMTAVAFWQFHYHLLNSEAPHVIYPAVNGGETAVLYCFIFFYILFAGPGTLSVDSLFGGDGAGKK